MRDRLYRSRDDVVIGGVAAGVATSLDMDPSIVRIVWVLLALLTGGVAALVYLIMLIVVPQEPLAAEPFGPEPSGAQPFGAEPIGVAGTPSEPAQGAEPGAPGWSDAGTGAPMAARPVSRAEARRARRGERDAGGAIVFGVILILVGGYFLVRQYVPQIDLDVVWPIAVVVVGLLLLAGALRPGARSGG